MHNTAGYSGRGVRFVDHRGALEVHRSVDVDAGEQVFYVVKGAVESQPVHADARTSPFDAVTHVAAPRGQAGGACDVLHAGNNVRTR
jgi:hypothetical protein